MASAIPSVEVAIDALLERGFLYWEDLTVGDGIQGTEKKEFNYSSVDGLEVCQKHVLSNHILSIVQSFFGDETCALGHGLGYKEYPYHILCFRRGGPEAGRRVLVVHLLTKGTRVGYYGGSHLHSFPTINGRRFLYEIEQVALDKAGLQCDEKFFPDGGLTIFDARIGFEVKEGFANTYEFATIDVVKGWRKMILPSSPELIQKVRDMKRNLEDRHFHIQMNFKFDTDA